MGEENFNLFFDLPRHFFRPGGPPFFVGKEVLVILASFFVGAAATRASRLAALTGDRPLGRASSRFGIEACRGRDRRARVTQDQWASTTSRSQVVSICQKRTRQPAQAGSARCVCTCASARGCSHSSGRPCVRAARALDHHLSVPAHDHAGSHGCATHSAHQPAARARSARRRRARCHGLCGLTQASVPKRELARPKGRSPVNAADLARAASPRLPRKKRLKITNTSVTIKKGGPPPLKKWRGGG